LAGLKKQAAALRSRIKQKDLKIEWETSFGSDRRRGRLLFSLKVQFNRRRELGGKPAGSFVNRLERRVGALPGGITLNDHIIISFWLELF
jgi:hypothetical protein